MTTTAVPPVTVDLDETTAFATAYSDAWNARDVDRIMSMHAADTAFHLHVHPYPEASGPEAVRAQFEAIFTAMPDLTFETIRVEVRAGLFTMEWYATTTLATPFPIGERVFEPTGKAVRFRGVDVISCEEGLVRRKDCYLDGVALELALFPAP